MAEPRLADGSLAKPGMRVRCVDASPSETLKISPPAEGKITGTCGGIEVCLDDEWTWWKSVRFTPIQETKNVTTEVSYPEKLAELKRRWDEGGWISCAVEMPPDDVTVDAINDGGTFYVEQVMRDDGVWRWRNGGKSLAPPDYWKPVVPAPQPAPPAEPDEIDYKPVPKKIIRKGTIVWDDADPPVTGGVELPASMVATPAMTDERLSEILAGNYGNGWINAMHELTDEIRRCWNLIGKLTGELAEAVSSRDRRIAELEAELDPPVCRLQFPGGGTPNNVREAAETWKAIADKNASSADDMRRKVFEHAKTLRERDAEIAELKRHRDEAWERCTNLEERARDARGVISERDTEIERLKGDVSVWRLHANNRAAEIERLKSHQSPTCNIEALRPYLYPAEPELSPE